MRPQTQMSCPALSQHCGHHSGLVVLVLRCLKSLSSPCALGKQDWERPFWMWTCATSRSSGNLHLFPSWFSWSHFPVVPHPSCRPLPKSHMGLASSPTRNTTRQPDKPHSRVFKTGPFSILFRPIKILHSQVEVGE